MRLSKYAMIGTVSALALAHAAPVLAQDAEEDDTIVITGIRKSVQDSLDAKRNADALIESINAEDIGKFPDKNVAESLQRVPGVSINREFGEGERVSIRGTDTNLTRTMLNGHAVGTADWFILDQLDASRSFNYLMLPSEIVSAIDIYKSPQADIDEGGIGGTVNVKTLKPLDGQDFSVAGSIGASYADLADEAKPQGSLLVNWRNADKTLGINVAAIYQERELRRDGIEVLGYSPVTPSDINSGIPAEGALVPDLIGSALFTQNRTRQGINGAVQWQPNDRFDVTFSALYSELGADNQNLNFLASPSRKTNVDGNFFTATEVRDGTVFAGEFAPGGPGFSMIYDAFYREAKTHTSFYDVEGSYELDDKTTWSFQGGFTEAKGATERQIGWETLATAPGFSYDLSGGVPRVEFDDQVDIADPTDPFYLSEVGWAGAASVTNTDEEFYLFSDLEREFDNAGPIKSVKVGLKYTDHDRETLQLTGQRRSLFSWGSTTATGCDGNGGVQHFASPAAMTAAGYHRCGTADISSGLTPSNFLDDIAVSGTITSYLATDPDLLKAVLDAIPVEAYAGADAGPFAPERIDYIEPGASFSVNETTVGGFVMANLEGEGWRGNIGVRIVNTDVESEGWQTGLELGDDGTQADNFFIPPEYVGGYVAPTTDSRSYTDVLPSLNLSYDITDDFLIRVAASRAMTRPNYNQLADSITLNPTSFTGTGGGGTRLDPFYANQYDLSLEWYYAPQSAVNVGLFYKDLTSVIALDEGVERWPIVPSIDDNGTPGDTSDDFPVLNDDCTYVSGTFPNATYDCNFDVTRPRNVGGATLQGIELAWQHSFDNGFGFLTNYTYTDAEQNDGLPMPGASEHLANLTGYYENEFVSARLSYNYRSDFFLKIDRADELSQDATKSLDASVTFNVNDKYSISADAVNLTDEEVLQYSGFEERTRAIYDNGRIFYLTLRGKL